MVRSKTKRYSGSQLSIKHTKKEYYPTSVGSPRTSAPIGRYDKVKLQEVLLTYFLAIPRSSNLHCITGIDNRFSSLPQYCISHSTHTILKTRQLNVTFFRSTIKLSTLFDPQTYSTAIYSMLVVATIARQFQIGALASLQFFRWFLGGNRHVRSK